MRGPLPADPAPRPRRPPTELVGEDLGGEDAPEGDDDGEPDERSDDGGLGDDGVEMADPDEDREDPDDGQDDAGEDVPHAGDDHHGRDVATEETPGPQLLVGDDDAGRAAPREEVADRAAAGVDDHRLRMRQTLERAGVEEGDEPQPGDHEDGEADDGPEPQPRQGAPDVGPRRVRDARQAPPQQEDGQPDPDDELDGLPDPRAGHVRPAKTSCCMPLGSLPDPRPVRWGVASTNHSRPNTRS